MQFRSQADATSGAGYDHEPFFLKCLNDTLDGGTRQFHALRDLTQAHSARRFLEGPQHGGGARNHLYALTSACLVRVHFFGGHAKPF